MKSFVHYSVIQVFFLSSVFTQTKIPKCYIIFEHYQVKISINYFWLHYNELFVFLCPLGGDASAQATNGDTVLYDAAGSGNLDCIHLLLQYGASPNTASLCSQLPIHRAAYEGHYL